jgi:hypothetical protein
VALQPLFLGLLIILWLSIGVAGWLIATLRFRPRASLVALAAAEIVALVMGPLPGLLGWTTIWGLAFGLLLALVCSTAAAWQTMSRMRGRVPHRGGPGSSANRDG